MPEPAINIPDNLFSRKLLRASHAVGGSPLGALLETLCIDDIYSVRDDFERGIDATRWDSAKLYHQPNDLQGSIASFGLGDEAIEDEGSVIRLSSKVGGWRAVNRASAIIRFSLSSLRGKLEFGFETGGDRDAGVILAKVGPSAVSTANNFGLLVRDTDNNTNLGIVRRDGRSGTVRNTDITPAITFEAVKPQTLLVSLQEQGDVLVWVNGKFVQSVQNGPEAREYLNLWFHISPRADGLPNVSIDYIFAWQERSAVVTWPEKALGQTT